MHLVRVTDHEVKELERTVAMVQPQHSGLQVRRCQTTSPCRSRHRYPHLQPGWPVADLVALAWRLERLSSVHLWLFASERIKN